MVPVGASTDACALRQPFFAPISRHLVHSALATDQTSESSVVTERADAEAFVCFCMTRVCAAALRA